MHSSEVALLGQMITDVREDIRDLRREFRVDIRNLDRRLGKMESSKSTAPDIPSAEKWIVRVTTIGLPTATFLLTGSAEKAWQVLQAVSHFTR